MADDKCVATPDMVRRIIKDAGFEINQYAEAYIKALDSSEAVYGCDGVQSQAAYIYGNLTAKTDEQKHAKQQLLDISRGQIPNIIYKPPAANRMTEIELEDISNAFESYTENRVSSFESQCPVGTLGLEEFENFAKRYNHPLDKVMVANPWVNKCLSDEVKREIDKAKERVKILWEG